MGLMTNVDAKLLVFQSKFMLPELEPPVYSGPVDPVHSYVQGSVEFGSVLIVSTQACKAAFAPHYQDSASLSN